MAYNLKDLDESLNAARAKYPAVMDIASLQRSAPSVFADKPFQDRSEKYRFLPTIDVVGEMVKEGFVPVTAGQSKSRRSERGNYTRHVMRFRHLHQMEKPLKKDDELPELVLLNSHDGTSSYQLMAGFFRVVCSNGMVVCSSQMDSIKVRHSGSTDLAKQIVDASYEVIGNIGSATMQIEAWKSIQLDKGKQIAYVKTALELRAGALNADPDLILNAIRAEDTPENDGQRSLWKTFNVVQEKLIKGGFRAPDINENLRRVRAIKSASEDVKINRMLWTLTEEMQRLAA